MGTITYFSHQVAEDCCFVTKCSMAIRIVFVVRDQDNAEEQFNGLFGAFYKLALYKAAITTEKRIVS